VDLNEKIAVVCTSLISLIKIFDIEVFKDVLHGAGAAVGGLLVATIYHFFKKLWQKRREKQQKEKQQEKGQ